MDFEELGLALQSALDQAGPGQQPGDRSEVYRRLDDWMLMLIMIWDGRSWLPLALEVRHLEEQEGHERDELQWQQRKSALLASLDRQRLSELPWPDLLEISAPDWNPAVPGEYRRRRFVHGNFWFEFRWMNVGGLDDDAEWLLRSYRAVAEPLSPVNSPRR